MTTGVFGSAFNPPTLGHDDAIRQALEKVEKVILVPSALHPWGKKMLDFDLRVSMLNDYVENAFPCGRVTVSDIEKGLAKSGEPIYTWRLMDALSEEMKNEQLTFLCGPDVIANWSKFDKSDYISERWGVLGFEERKTIRSTLVRENAKNGLPLTGLVTPFVAELIKNNNLYA